MLVNPISFRLSVSFFWNSTWSLYKNNNYKYLFSSDLVFFEFFMFFFRKTIDFRALDYYPSHIRLYRLQDKIIINLYYHMSKEEYYFDEIDLIYKGSSKRVIIKKKLLRKRKIKNNILHNNIILNNFFFIKKITNFIDKNLIKIIFFKLIYSSLKDVYFDLENNLHLKWTSIENYIKSTFIKSDKINWFVVKDFVKNYYFKTGKKYIYFFINNMQLINNLKKNFNKNLKIKNNNFKQVMFSNNNINIKNSKLLYRIRLYYKNKSNIKNLLFNKNYVKFLLKFFWKKKIKNKNILKKKKIFYFFKNKSKILNLNKDILLRNSYVFSTNISNLNEFELLEKLKDKLLSPNLKPKVKNNIRILSNINNDPIKIFSMKKFNKTDIIIKKVKKVFSKLESYKKLKKIRYHILKLQKQLNKNYVLNNNLNNINYSLQDFNYLYKINFLKFIYNQKLWIFNIYYYYLSKFLKQISKNLFFKFLKKIELNIFKINIHAIRADIISKYITSSFRHNYSIYETMRPVLVDLKDRMKKKKVSGFKITVSGRFKRAQRATYWWRKDGQLLTGTQTAAIDYSSSLHKTKYGVCTVNVWLTPGLKGFGALVHEYPTFYPFFFIQKKDKIGGFNYFLLKRNELFFSNLLKKCQMSAFNLKKNYVRGLLSYLLYKYMYINIFLRNIVVSSKINKINKNFKRIFLPQYCIYKIYLEEFLLKNYIKVIPFIHVKMLKRLNLRNSYRVSFLNKSKLIYLDIFKYKISLS